MQRVELVYFNQFGPESWVLIFEDFCVAEEIVNVVVDCGAVPALVKHLQVPSLGSEGDGGQMPYEHEVEKGSAFTLGLLAIKVSINHIYSLKS